MNTFKDKAIELFDNGYQPIPIYPKNKKPALEGWTEIPITREWVEARAANGSAEMGVGLRCGKGDALGIYGADFDFYDKDVTVRVHKSFVSRFGEAPARIGRKPKALLVYAGKPGKTKEKRLWRDPSGKEHGFELLGDGQQFVAFGIHPETGKPYSWVKGNLKKVSELPVLDFDQVIDWIDNELPALIPTDWTPVSSKLPAAKADKPKIEPTTFFGRVNQMAIEKLAAWVPEIFPEAIDYHGGYRITSESVGRSLQEDISAVPSGIVDWGLADQGDQRAGKRTPIELVSEWYGWAERESEDEREFNHQQAALWLCERLNVEPDTLGYSTASDDFGQPIDGDRKTALAVYISEIEGATTEEQLRATAQHAKADPKLDKLAKEALAGITQVKFKDIFGTKPSIGTVKEMYGLSAPSVRQEMATDVPDWLTNWIYITGEDKFFNTSTKQRMSRSAFDVEFNRFCRDHAADNGRVSAAALASNLWDIETVESAMYVPYLAQRFTLDGLKRVNLYRPSSVPRAQLGLSFEDDTLIERMEWHFKALIPVEEYRRKLLQWMAYNVTHPGEKIRYMPLIKGIPGDGKTLLGDMMMAAMGAENVGVLAPSTISESNFTDWASGKALNIIEEIRMKGHNRYDVWNKCKPLITNDRVEWHQKGKAPQTVLNTTNYFALTNFSDAIPIDDTDRRGLVLFSPWTDIKMLEGFIQKEREEDPAMFWTSLWNMVRERPELMRYYFENISLDDFNKDGRAPETIYKASMAASGSSEEMEAIAAILSEGAYGVSLTVVEPGRVKSMLDISHPELQMTTKKVSAVLADMGFIRKKDQVKWDGEPRRICYRQSIGHDPSADVIRSELDKTINLKKGEEAF